MRIALVVLSVIFLTLPASSWARGSRSGDSMQIRQMLREDSKCPDGQALAKNACGQELCAAVTRRKPAKTAAKCPKGTSWRIVGDDCRCAKPEPKAAAKPEPRALSRDDDPEAGH